MAQLRLLKMTDSMTAADLQMMGPRLMTSLMALQAHL